MLQIVSNQLVEWNNGGFRSPFVASGCLLLLAWAVISGSWSENYGGGAGAGVAQASADVFQIRRLGAAWRIVAAGSYESSISSVEAHSRRRPYPPRSWPDTDNIRGLYVSFRLHLGPDTARVVSLPIVSSPGLHFFGFYGVNDARIPDLHVRHCTLVPSDTHIGPANAHALLLCLLSVSSRESNPDAACAVVSSRLCSSSCYIRCVCQRWERERRTRRTP